MKEDNEDGKDEYDKLDKGDCVGYGIADEAVATLGNGAVGTM